MVYRDGVPGLEPRETRGTRQLAKMMSLARKGIESLIARQQAVLAGLPLQQ